MADSHQPLSLDARLTLMLCSGVGTTLAIVVLTLYFDLPRLPLLILAAVVISVPLLLTYLDTGLVPRLPTAILATGMVIVAVLSFFAGLILDTVTRGRREMRRLAYLAHSAPSVAKK